MENTHLGRLHQVPRNVVGNYVCQNFLQMRCHFRGIKDSFQESGFGLENPKWLEGDDVHSGRLPSSWCPIVDSQGGILLKPSRWHFCTRAREAECSVSSCSLWNLSLRGPTNDPGSKLISGNKQAGKQSRTVEEQFSLW